MMQVTDTGIDWFRLLPDDLDVYGAVVADAARDTCRCGRDQLREPHYLDQLGREVCPVAGLSRLHELANLWHGGPMKRALPKAPSIDAYSV